MAYKKGQDRRQRVLFPDCIDEYVETDAPVRLFDAFVDSLKMYKLGFVRMLGELNRLAKYVVSLCNSQLFLCNTPILLSF